MAGRPFLFLSIRGEDEAADDEFAAVLRFGGLSADEVSRVRLDRAPLGRVDPDEFSAIVLGGGPYNFTDPDDAKSPDQRRVETDLMGLLRDVVARDTPFLGCCYGIGALGTFLGGTVDRRYSEQVGPVPITLTDAGRTDPLLAGLPAEFEAFVGHKEAVSALPPSAVVLAYSAACPVQAFRVGANVYATQFHPELDVPGICTRIDVYKHHGYFAPDAAEALKAEMRRSQVTHPPEILRNFVRRFRRAR